MLLTKKLEISRFTTQTIVAGDVTIAIDFDGEEIRGIRASYPDAEGEPRLKIELPAEMLERVAAAVYEARRFGEFHGPARNKEVCPIHGYVERTKKYECVLCEPEQAFNEKQTHRLVVNAVNEHDQVKAALVAFALRKENVEVKSIKPAPGKDAVGYLIETPDDIWHAIPRADAPNGWRFLAVDPATLPARA